MPWADILDSLWKAIVVLGGGTVVIGAISAFVSKYFADRSIEGHKAQLNKEVERLKGELAKETETHKLKLKKQEMLFTKELDAAVQFFALHKHIRPSYSHPDMDWDEAVEEVARDFTDTEHRLKKFMTEHGPVLSERVRDDLEHCADLASNNKFASSGVGLGDMRVAKEAAKEVLKRLKEIEEQLVTELRS
jgi:hypothetical protein